MASSKIKVTGTVLAALVCVVAGSWWWLQGNLDGLIKKAIVQYGSEMTAAQVSVESVQVQVKEGRVILRKLQVGNPAGFKTSHAFKVDEVELAIDIASVTKPVVTIEKILIKAPDVILEKGSDMTNLDALQKNMAKHLGQETKQTNKDAEPGKKLIVGQLSMTDMRAQASAPFMNGDTVAISLPNIELRDLGKSKGGLPPGELGQEVVQALKQKLSASFSFEGAAKSVGETADKAVNAIKGLFSK